MDIYNVYKAKGKEIIWEIPYDLLKELNLTSNESVMLHFGSLSVYAKITTPYRSNKRWMGFSGPALDFLKLPKEIPLKVKRVGKREFRLGPIIGILTFKHLVKHRAFRGYIPYAKRMKGTGLLYVFGPQDIDEETKTIKGYTYNEKTNKWEQELFPYPDAVVDRIYPNNRSAQSKLEKVIGQNRIFNKNNRINKMEFGSILHRSPFLRKFIPETKPYVESNDLKTFLHKYRHVFLKPVGGMKGWGIVSVTAEENDLKCRYMAGKKPKSEIISQPEEIFDIMDKVNKRMKPYIIQAAIPRMECLGRPFDFRVMVAKNGSGHWSVPAIFARVARPDGFLTNNSAGADFSLTNDLFENISYKLPYSKERCLALITDLSIKAARALDKELGPLGNLGMDLVIDPSGKPWLIEANGNPGAIRWWELSEYPDWRTQMYDYPLAYAVRIAGFGDTK